MTERTDHAAEARLWAENAVMAQAARNEQQNEQLATAYAAIGQVHATLALVEQQRITNLIALTNRTASFDDEMAYLGDEAANRLVEMVRTPATPFGGPDENVQVRADVREGLGL